MPLLLVYGLFCILVGYVAGQKGRSGFGWFLASLFLTPLAGIVFVAVLPSRLAQPMTLESQVRDSLLEARFDPYIRSHKPAFSSRFVHEVNLTGDRVWFTTKPEAIAYCMVNLPKHEIEQSHAPEISL